MNRKSIVNLVEKFAFMVCLRRYRGYGCGSSEEGFPLAYAEGTDDAPEENQDNALSDDGDFKSLAPVIGACDDDNPKDIAVEIISKEVAQLLDSRAQQDLKDAVGAQNPYSNIQEDLTGATCNTPVELWSPNNSEILDVISYNIKMDGFEGSQDMWTHGINHHPAPTQTDYADEKLTNEVTETDDALIVEENLKMHVDCSLGLPRCRLTQAANQEGFSLKPEPRNDYHDTNQQFAYGSQPSIGVVGHHDGDP